MVMKDTVYCERANGRVEFWTYVEGRRIYLNAVTVEKWLAKKTATIVNV